MQEHVLHYSFAETGVPCLHVEITFLSLLRAVTLQAELTVCFTNITAWEKQPLCMCVYILYVFSHIYYYHYRDIFLCIDMPYISTDYEDTMSNVYSAKTR